MTRSITLPQTVALMSLDMGQQPWLAPAIRSRALKRGWIARSGTRKSKRGYERPLYELTDAGRAALAASEHRDVAEARIRIGLQKGPWP